MDQGRPAGPQGPWALPTVVSSRIPSAGSAAKAVLCPLRVLPCTCIRGLHGDAHTHRLWARGGGVRATFGLLWESPCPARRQSPSTECWIHSKRVNEGISPREQLCLSTVSLSKQDLCLVPESHSRCWKVTPWLKASGLPWWPSG